MTIVYLVENFKCLFLKIDITSDFSQHSPSKLILVSFKKRNQLIEKKLNNGSLNG